MDMNNALPRSTPQRRASPIEPHNALGGRLNDIYLKAAILAGMLLVHGYINNPGPHMADTPVPRPQTASQMPGVGPLNVPRRHEPQRIQPSAVTEFIAASPKVSQSHRSKSAQGQSAPPQTQMTARSNIPSSYGQNVVGTSHPISDHDSAHRRLEFAF